MIPLRSFPEIVTASGILPALGDLGFLARLPSFTAAKVALEPRMGRFHPEIEPRVCLLEEMVRNRVLEVIRRVKHGLIYRELLPRLLLAGVRSIQPRPVGSEFHEVMVANSAHLASLGSPNTNDRWLPMFWAIDRYKASQAANAREGDWTMGASARLCSCVRAP